MFRRRARVDSLSPQKDNPPATTHKLAQTNLEKELPRTPVPEVPTVERPITRGQAPKVTATLPDDHRLVRERAVAEPLLQTQTPPNTTNKACLPFPQSSSIKRSSRPFELQLDTSHGCSAVPSNTLKQQIRNARSQDDGLTTTIQVPTDKRAPLPPTPTTPFVMGNSSSNTSSSSHIPSEQTMNELAPGVISPPQNARDLSKRRDSASPLSHDTLLDQSSSTRRHSPDHSNLTDRREYGVHHPNNVVNTSVEPWKSRSPRKDESLPSIVQKTRSRPEGLPVVQVASHGPKIFVNSERDLDQPAQWNQQPERSTQDPRNGPPWTSHQPIPALLPTPPTLPEDSRHKHDSLDENEIQITEQVPEHISEVKRRGSDSDNDSSNARGTNVSRAQPIHANTLPQHTQAFRSVSAFQSPANGSRPRPTHDPSFDVPRPTPETAILSIVDGTGLLSSLADAQLSAKSSEDSTRADSSPWQNFKSSGFAYSRPLNHIQKHCFSNHSHLLPTKNHYAPVECGICHLDDNAEHWTCSWCAVRMCSNCRRELLARAYARLKGENNAMLLRPVPPSEYIE